MKSVLLLAAVLLSAPVQAAVKNKVIEYKDGQTVMEGYLAFDDAVQGQRPAVLVIHDWMGISPFTKSKVEELARLGYVAFAADIYGKGVRPKNAKAASGLAGKYKADRAQLRSRARAALEVLRTQPETNPQKTAAMGYCFGGTTALELARSGAPINGAVSFHGGLSTPTPEDAKNIKAKVLVLHGADDPHVPPEEVAAFEKEMNDAKVDWQLVKYSGAVHSFAVPAAGSNNSTGNAYNAAADRRSWQAMKDFYNELFL